MRDVTIFIADEKHERIIQFLEKWYFKKKRRMNEAEMAHAANELNIDLPTMSDL